MRGSHLQKQITDNQNHATTPHLVEPHRTLLCRPTSSENPRLQCVTASRSLQPVTLLLTWPGVQEQRAAACFLHRLRCPVPTSWKRSPPRCGKTTLHPQANDGRSFMWHIARKYVVETCIVLGVTCSVEDSMCLMSTWSATDGTLVLRILSTTLSPPFLCGASWNLGVSPRRQTECSTWPAAQGRTVIAKIANAPHGWYPFQLTCARKQHHALTTEHLWFRSWPSPTVQRATEESSPA